MSEVLPEEWRVTALENCVRILDAQRVPINNEERQQRIEGKSESELFPYYGATGQVGLIDSYLFDEELVALGEDGVPFLDPLKNKAYLLVGKTWVNNHAHVLKAIEGVSTNKFLLYYLNQFDYQEYVNGATRLKLTQANMRLMPVNVPPLAEQQEIAARLDELLAQVDTIKARLDAIPAILKRFRQSVLNSYFDSHVKKVTIEHLCKKITDGEHITPNTTSEGVPLLSAKDVREERLLFDECKFVSQEVATKALARCNPEKGDILIVSRGATIGRSHLVSIAKEFCLMGSVLLLKPDLIKILPSYLYWALRSPDNQKIMLDLSGSSAQQAIYIRDIKSLKISMHPLPEQTEIVRRVEQLFAFADQIEQQVQAAQTRVNKLTQAILAKAFKGELTADWRAAHPELISGENSAQALLDKIKAAPTPSKPKRSKAQQAELF